MTMLVFEMKKMGFDEEGYDNIRDCICRSLQGNKAFIENDIVVSDARKPEYLDVLLGEASDNDLTIHISETKMRNGIWLNW